MATVDKNMDAKPAPPPVEMIKVKVDGREIEVPKMMPDHTGKLAPTTMLQACKLAGVEIPHYCYHPKLPIAGNCRMCLVEFGTPVFGADRKMVLNEKGEPVIQRSILPYEPGTPRGAIACATPISPGMEIYPNSPATKQMREAVLESLLINHPLDCPICDQAGECKLQEYSLEHGQAQSSFVETKVHKPKQVDLGPRIMLDDERCILCTRCIRFTRDIVKDDALGIVNRGSYNTISTYPGKKFDNNYTLNTVDICPVGALTSKDFRFKMRVWFLKETRGICSSCAMGCNILVGSRENVIHRLTPRENDAVNGHWMCDAGRLNYKWIGREDRLRQVVTPAAKAANRAAQWDEAIREIGNLLNRVPRGSVAIIASARLSTEELYLVSKLIKRMGAASDCVPRDGDGDRFLIDVDKNPNSNGARLTGVCYTETGIKLPDIVDSIKQGKIKTLIALGEDVTKPDVGLTPELLAKLDHLIVSDILPNNTTKLAHYLLPGCAHVEKRGTFINTKGRVQKFLKVVEPPGDARPESEFLGELLKQLNVQINYASAEGLFNQMVAEVPAFKDLSWAKIGDLGVDVPV